MKRYLLVALTGAIALAAQATTLTSSGTTPVGASITVQAGRGITAAIGAGTYDLLDELDTQFAFVAIQIGSHAFGQFRHRTEDETGIIDFTGDVTCMAVDPVNHRAWIGGVITANRSTSPNFTTLPIHEVGHDIWFRVLDNGGTGDPDRSTFVGFESAAIPTSAAYCEMRIWPDVPVVNARTWPVISGNLLVHP